MTKPKKKTPKPPKALTLIICGHGKMADEMMKVCKGRSDIQALRFDDRRVKELILRKNEYKNKVVAVHFGSGTQLVELLTFCGKLKIPVIQGSSQGPHMPELPKKLPTIVVNAPNTAIPIIALFHIMPHLKRAFDGMHVSITESHQVSKGTTASTAEKFAKELEVPVRSIASVRDPVRQKLLGIPEKFLDSHAYHMIVAEGMAVKIELSVNTFGRASYAIGVLAIARTLITLDFQESILYEVEEIMGIPL